MACWLFKHRDSFTLTLP